MDPADMHYRLTRWHGVQITREQLQQTLVPFGYSQVPSDHAWPSPVPESRAGD